MKMTVIQNCFTRYCWLWAILLLSACSNNPPQNSDVSLPKTLPIVQTKSERPLIALALGSGGGRGYAHIGVIKVLEENNIPINLVAGTSAGSVVGALYAGGYHAKELEELALKVEEKDLRDFGLAKSGYIRGESLEKFINEALHNRPIEQLDKPFAALSTDLSNGKVAIFNHGNTGLAVRASSSIPGVFQPVTINSSQYVDGALKNPVPVTVAHQMGADIVIAVDISQQFQNSPEDPNIIQILTQSLRIMRQKLTDDDIVQAEIVIRPLINVTSNIDTMTKQQLIKFGADATIAALPAIRELIRKRSSEKF